jgi:hypothetical protein
MTCIVLAGVQIQYKACIQQKLGAIRYWICALSSHQQIKEDLARQYGAHVIDTTGSTFTISYEQLYPVVVSPRAYVTVTLVTPDVT